MKDSPKLFLDPNYVTRCFEFEVGSIIKTRAAHIINAAVIALVSYLIKREKEVLRMSELSDKHPIEGLMSSAMQGLKEMIDVNTIVGSPITTSGRNCYNAYFKGGFGFLESEALSFLKTKTAQR